ncbi:hypothetical protein [Alcaligenes aquatilis]|nr:hypothetical protein [Alcaligenes aquatilis]
MIAVDYEFEPPTIACVVRLRDVLESMSDAEQALQAIFSRLSWIWYF